MVSRLQNLEKDDSKGEAYITSYILANYLDLPVFIAKKIFLALKSPNHDLEDKIYKDEFCLGMRNLYFGDLKSILDMTFRMIDFDEDGFISQADVRLFLVHLTHSSSDFIFPPQDLDIIIEDFFKACNCLNLVDFQKYSGAIENSNSDLFVVILIYLYEKQHFTEQSFNFYAIFLKNNENFDFNKNKYSDKIAKPSELITKKFKYFSFYEKCSEVKPKGKDASKELLRYSKNTKCEFKRMLTFSDFDNFDDNISDRSECIELHQIEHYSCKRPTFPSEEAYNTLKVFKQDNNGQIENFELILVDKDIYVMNTSKQKELEQIHPLTGYYPIFHSKLNKNCCLITFLLKFGNSYANKRIIYFSHNNLEAEVFMQEVRKVLGVRNIKEHYTFTNQYSKGGNSTLYEGVNVSSEEKCAIRSIDKSKLTYDCLEAVRREIDILKFLSQINHPGIIKVHDVFEDQDYIYIVTECLQGGSLSSFMKENSLVSESTNKETNALLQNIYLQLTKSLEFLRSLGITHIEINPENILLESQVIVNSTLDTDTDSESSLGGNNSINKYTLKICDFSLRKESINDNSSKFHPKNLNQFLFDDWNQGVNQQSKGESSMIQVVNVIKELSLK